ncbi:UNVERIFIED_CONTAM: hypothetical protein GTU68_047086 [Idotea baltica]|nr:hypothetical protein [Idotea baltica]
MEKVSPVMGLEKRTKCQKQFVRAEKLRVSR